MRNVVFFSLSLQATTSNNINFTMMNNTMTFTVWFLMMLAITIGLVFTGAQSNTITTINSAVRLEETILLHTSCTLTTDHFGSLMVAKLARAKLELYPVRVGRHFVLAEKSPWTLSIEQRHH